MKRNECVWDDSFTAAAGEEHAGEIDRPEALENVCGSEGVSCVHVAESLLRRATVNSGRGGDGSPLRLRPQRQEGRREGDYEGLSVSE